MSERVFERKIYQKMLEWKKESNGKTALLIKGARRVGKSTIAEEFAKKEYSSYILIDFSIAPKEIQAKDSLAKYMPFTHKKLNNEYNVKINLDSLKEITDWITTDTMAMIEMQNKVNSIENGAQENKIEQIKIGDSLIEITDKVANIPVATIDAYGVVKSSTAINQINVDETGFMEVNSISVEKLRNDDCQLILRSGKAQI